VLVDLAGAELVLEQLDDVAGGVLGADEGIGGVGLIEVLRVGGLRWWGLMGCGALGGGGAA
jgi:hypothetical protein